MIGPKASYALAASIAFAALLKFLKWLIPFLFERLDVERGHLGERLKHVEMELDAYREATMLMIGVVAKLDPENPALRKVAAILRQTSPRSTLELSELVDRLNQLPGTRGGANGTAA